MRIHPAHGSSFTFDQIKMPSDDDVDITGMLVHKMWHGHHELAAVARQAARTKDDTTLYFVADRHHPGMTVSHGKAFWMDAGKQAVMPYVQMIGKATGCRGTVAAGYSPRGHEIFSGYFYLDRVVDKLIGWEKKSEMLKEVHQLIKEGKTSYAKKSM